MKYDWLKDYGDNTPEPLEMRADERARVLANALGKVEIIQSTTKRNAGQKRRLLRWAAVLAAVLTLGMLTAGAASGTIEVGELLYWIFGAQTTPEQLDGLALAGTPIGQSQTRDGYTVHLYGAVGDKFSCYLVFDVTAPAGTVLDNGNGYGFQSAELWQTERDSGPAPICRMKIPQTVWRDLWWHMSRTGPSREGTIPCGWKGSRHTWTTVPETARGGMKGCCLMRSGNFPSPWITQIRPSVSRQVGGWISGAGKRCCIRLRYPRFPSGWIFGKVSPICFGSRQAAARSRRKSY